MQTIIYKKENRIAFITLNRPEKRNALNAEMVEELRLAFEDAGRSDEVKIVVLQASGKAFSAGADLVSLQKLQNNTFEENLADSQNLKDLFYQIYTHPRLVMAQVEGTAIAGGCGLAMVCDLCYAVPEAVFGFSEVKIGFVPALVSVFLSRKIGEGAARNLLLTGRNIRAEEARGMGLINGIFAKNEIKKEIEAMADKLATETSASAIMLTKQLLAGAAGLPMDEALHLAARYNAEARATADCKAGIQAFLAGEKVKW